MPDAGRLRELRAKKPLIHCISNQVSANDCANLLLALGASPMMACAPEEMTEITVLSDATVLNTGTPEASRYEACRLCGEKAAALGQPIVLDPVGVGASAWRLGEITALLDRFTPTILRCNLGEARALLRERGEERGVDSLLSAGREERAETASRLARLFGTVVLLTGEDDTVSDGERIRVISGGSGMMTAVTGTGCMLSALCGAFAAVEPSALEAAFLASAFWKRCAERAAAEQTGPGRFRAALMDAAWAMTDL